MPQPRELAFVQGLKFYCLAKGLELTADNFDDQVLALLTDLAHLAGKLTGCDFNELVYRAICAYNEGVDEDHKLLICTYVADKD